MTHHIWYFSWDNYICNRYILLKVIIRKSRGGVSLVDIPTFYSELLLVEKHSYLCSKTISLKEFMWTFFDTINTPFITIVHLANQKRVVVGQRKKGKKMIYCRANLLQFKKDTTYMHQGCQKWGYWSYVDGALIIFSQNWKKKPINFNQNTEVH